MQPDPHYLIEDGEIELNARRPAESLLVANTGDRPVQVGSHAHFFEVNCALRFYREPAFGMRLDIPSGTATRFEPGQTHTVQLVAFGGSSVARGMNALVNGATSEPAVRAHSLRLARERGFAGDAR